MYTVNFWGSHPSEGNDDCWTGEDYCDREEAEAAFAKLPTSTTIAAAYIELDGPDIYKVRKNPAFSARRAARDAAAEARAWKLEMAMEAGMAFGCDGYNDVMGYS